MKWSAADLWHGQAESVDGKVRPALRLAPWLGLLMLALACALPSLGGQRSGELLPRGANPILVTVPQPHSGGAYPVGGVIQVTAEALGADAIVSLELWADGDLIEAHDFRGQDRNFVRGSWPWSVPSLGEHLLIVRAIDAQGRSAESEVVRLGGIADPGARVLFTARGGETLSSLADEFGASLGNLAEANPGLPDQPLAAGGQVWIPITASPPLEPASPSQPPPPASVDPSLPAPLALASGSTAPPSAPTLTFAPAGCTARLYIQDASANEDGFFVYRVGPGATSFSRIATLGAHTGDGAIAYDAAMTTGNHQLYAASFNAVGEAASNVVAFAAPQETCSSGESGLRIEGDTLILPQALDLAYVYYSADGAPWNRLPADAHAYFEPLADAVALGALLQSASLDLDVWGWDGGVLVYLGSLHTAGSTDMPPSLPAQAGPAELLGCPIAGCSGDVGGTQWAPQITVNDFAPRDFRWTAPAPGVTGGLWQLSMEPFGAACSLSPSGLLMSDIIPTSGGKTVFPIDLGPLAPKPLQASEDNAPLAAAGAPIVPGLPTLNQDSLLEMDASPGAAIPGLSQGLANDADAQAASSAPNFFLPLDAFLDHYYVRVLPIANGQPQCQPSTTAVVVYDPTSPQFTFLAPDYSRFVAQYDVDIIEYDAPVFPDPNLWGCVQVTQVDLIPGSPLNNAYAGLVGKTVCPESWQGDSGQGFGGLLDDIASAWDYVVGLYNKLEGLVKDFVAKFNPVCLQAQWAAEAVGSGEAKTTIQDACEIGASIAIAAAKAYVGIPPSLPKWDQLDDLGKEYLVELAADEFTAQTGIPCDDECKDLMGEGVDMAQDSLSAGGSASACVSESEAHQHGVEPFCPPAGVKYKAAYGAEYLPPVAWLHITRLANSGNVPDPEPFPTCTTSLSMLTEYAFPGGTVYGPYSPNGTPSDIFPPQLVTVIPFVGVSAKIPRLDPGEQVTLAIPFKGAAPVLFPWTQQMYQPYQEVPNAYGDDFYDAIRDGTVRLTAYTVWPEYQALKAQYTGAANLSCAPPAELIVPPSP